MGIEGRGFCRQCMLVVSLSLCGGLDVGMAEEVYQGG